MQLIMKVTKQFWEMEVGSLTFHKSVALSQDIFHIGRRETAYTTLAKPYSYMTVESLQQPLQKVRATTSPTSPNNCTELGRAWLVAVNSCIFCLCLQFQDQPEKVKYAPQSKDIWHPCFCFILFYFISGHTLVVIMENLSNDNSHRFSPVV